MVEACFIVLLAVPRWLPFMKVTMMIRKLFISGTCLSVCVCVCLGYNSECICAHAIRCVCVLLSCGTGSPWKGCFVFCSLVYGACTCKSVLLVWYYAISSASHCRNVHNAQWPDINCAYSPCQQGKVTQQKEGAGRGTQLLSLLRPLELEQKERMTVMLMMPSRMLASSREACNCRAADRESQAGHGISPSRCKPQHPSLT